MKASANRGDNEMKFTYSDKQFFEVVDYIGAVSPIPMKIFATMARMGKENKVGKSFWE